MRYSSFSSFIFSSSFSARSYSISNTNRTAYSFVFLFQFLCVAASLRLFHFLFRHAEIGLPTSMVSILFSNSSIFFSISATDDMTPTALYRFDSDRIASSF